MKRSTTLTLLVSLCVALLEAPAAAQRVTSDILGTVRDTSEAAIPGAKVTARHVETGLERSTTTDSTGGYRISGFEPGTYEVRVEQQGFKTTIRKGITLLVNQQAIVDVTLQVGDIQQRIEVTGEAAILETTTSHMSNVVTEATLRELPLNGRDLFQLTALQTGVLPTTNAGPSPWSEGGITKAAVQGSRPTMNNFTLDGADINDPGFNIYPGGPAGAQLGVEAVKEFRVLLNTYSAEYGRNAGANVQFVTKSGTNDLHGSLFEFHRNAALDARNFFDPTTKPPFTRNQFGVTLGGPIVKNKTFFFANYEGLRESKSVTASLTVPDANAHNGQLPDSSGNLVNVGVNPLVRPFLELFPLPNGASLGGGLAELRTARKQPTREDYGLVRIDYQLTDKDQLFGRYVMDDGDTIVPFQSTFVPGFPGERILRNQYLVLSWQRLFRQNLLNDAKVNFNRTRYVAEVANSYPLSISLVANRPVGVMAIAGLPALGNNLIFPLGTSSNTFEFIDNLSHQRGHMNWKFGADIKRMQINGPFDLFIDAEYLFLGAGQSGGQFFVPRSANPPLESFLVGAPTVYLGTDPAFANSDRGFRQTYLGFYAQNDWQVRPHLTLNLGLRWEYSSNPGESQRRVANIRNVATDLTPTVGKVWESVPKNLFSPRVGFAWTPFARGKTAVRGAFGLLRDQLWSNLYFDIRFYEPFYRALLYIFPNLQTPPNNVNGLIGPPLNIPPAVIGSFGVTFRPDFPYYLQYNLNIQHELARDLLLQVAYVGSRGIHLVRTGEANPFVASLGRHINPNFGSIPLIITDAQSFYNSGQLSLQKRFSQGLSFQASYTYSRSIDDQSGPFPSDYVSESGVSQDFFNRKGDRARSSFDRKHAFVFNALYDLPFGPGRQWAHDATGASGKIIGGWGIGGIISVLSNVPFTANLGSFNNSGTQASFNGDRPNLRGALVNCGATILGKPDHWFDPSVFALPAAGQFGNVGRNTICGPNLRNVDFSVTKDTKIGERLGVQFRAEFFNLFNRTNFDVPVNTQGPNGNGGNGDAIFIGRKAPPCNPSTDPVGCGISAPNVGHIFRTATTSRQIQFGLKLTF